MNRIEFIEIMESYVLKLQNERTDIKAQMKEHGWNDSEDHMIRKIGHEISAINNAIREMKRQ